MIKILVADDHAIVRRGLKQIVAEVPGMVVADEASTGQEVLDKAGREDYDVILLDIAMPGISGLDVLKQLRATKPGIHVLILSIHPEEQYAMRALRAGACGYLTKESAPEELVAAIQRVATGGKYISSSLAEELASCLETDVEKPLHQTLSDREYQVMCLVASGKTIKEIAEELMLSVKTISTHRYRILMKMKMKSNAELTRYAIENRLVD